MLCQISTAFAVLREALKESQAIPKRLQRLPIIILVVFIPILALSLFLAAIMYHGNQETSITTALYSRKVREIFSAKYLILDFLWMSGMNSI
jgi:flagellar basal body-associated protein FliL